MGRTFFNSGSWHFNTTQVCIRLPGNDWVVLPYPKTWNSHVWCRKRKFMKEIPKLRGQHGEGRRNLLLVGETVLLLPRDTYPKRFCIEIFVYRRQKQSVKWGCVCVFRVLSTSFRVLSTLFQKLWHRWEEEFIFFHDFSFLASYIRISKFWKWQDGAFLPWQPHT